MAAGPIDVASEVSPVTCSTRAAVRQVPWFRWNSCCALAPNPPRGLHDQPELSFLVCWGDGVSDHRAGKATLRANCQTTQGYEAARFTDAPFQLVHRLKVGTL